MLISVFMAVNDDPLNADGRCSLRLAPETEPQFDDTRPCGAMPPRAPVAPPPEWGDTRLTMPTAEHQQRHEHTRVAIVGLGGIFPGAPDLERFWANIAGALDATREVPPGRWAIDPKEAFDPRVGQPDRVYSTRACFVENFRLDPEGLDLEPGLLDRLDPMFQLALHAGRQAWRDAVTEGLDRRRVGVVMGNLVLPTEGAAALARAYLGQSFDEQVEGPDAPQAVKERAGNNFPESEQAGVGGGGGGGGEPRGGGGGFSPPPGGGGGGPKKTPAPATLSRHTRQIGKLFPA